MNCLFLIYLIIIDLTLLNHSSWVGYCCNIISFFLIDYRHLYYILVIIDIKDYKIFKVVFLQLFLTKEDKLILINY
ncbi:uncharacterized protein BX663DRAFT_512986 [Cokeromyces recurvatus]|uniref:uncharacterized protein n=1 Tax=Cokeromyces recurvatus TaxID=90255 RepID=UPI002220E6E4|nr:uncharacterized protein BX663DRAFT_512986 [Cokeromyces recurvatus]KAI7901942.1 hypothetical protein BX663DRAFT_512986 [Cokeromyces recurvatus]